MLNTKITPPVPKGYSAELIAHVHTGSISMRRAMRYANELRTEINGGVEVFTGWCQFLEDGTRVGALAENESVEAWELPAKCGTVQWVKSPIWPVVKSGEIREFLISFKPFGEKNSKTMTAYYANEFRDNRGPIIHGIPMYNGWVVGHRTLGLSAFVTIGDQIVAWAELPVCDIRE